MQVHVQFDKGVAPKKQIPLKLVDRRVPCQFGGCHPPPKLGRRLIAADLDSQRAKVGSELQQQLGQARGEAEELAQARQKKEKGFWFILPPSNMEVQKDPFQERKAVVPQGSVHFHVSWWEGS